MKSDTLMTNSLLALLVLLANGLPGLAQAGGDSAATQRQPITKYQPSYFAQASPDSAWDMVLRVPGFTVQGVEEGVRGYGEARGNVLIDGVRPTSKFVTTEALLKRIPASLVKCIALVHGHVADIAMGGYNKVVNVVRKDKRGYHFAAKSGVLATTEGWVAPVATLEYGFQDRGQILRMAVTFEPELDDDSGEGTVLRLRPDGSVKSIGDLERAEHERSFNFAVNWKRTLGTGSLALNAAVGQKKEDEGTTIALRPGDAVDIRDDATERSRTLEVGARYVQDLGKRSTVMLLATQRLGRMDEVERSIERREKSTFGMHSETGESIVRTDLYSDWTSSFSTHASLEGAYNFLESRSELLLDGLQVSLPGSDVRVEEYRGEAAFKAIWQINGSWNSAVGMRVERSVLSVLGQSSRTRGFTYVKPAIHINWVVNDANQLQFSLAREVGQLDFTNFAASASLNTGTVSAGNAAIEPEKSTRLEVDWTHQLRNGGAFTLSWADERIDNVLDRVLIVTDDKVFDAPGNIGQGRKTVLGLDLMLPLERIGITGGRIQASVQWHDSEVTDPVTGRQRPISNEKPVTGSIRFSQDLPAWRFHWGFTLEHIAERSRYYRFNVVQHRSEDMGWTLFAEYRFDDHWRTRVALTDIFGRNFSKVRRKYEGARDVAPVAAIVRRQRRTPGYAYFTLRYDL